MKKTLFKGNYVFNIENYREAFNVSNKKLFNIASVTSLLSLCLWFFYMFNNLPTQWAVLLLIWIKLAYNVRAMNNNPKLIMKAINADYHKDSICTEVIFTENEIKTHNLESNWKLFYYYDQIFNFYETQNLFIITIWLPTKLLFISKDTFEWDNEQFKSFIQWKIEENKKLRKKKI